VVVPGAGGSAGAEVVSAADAGGSGHRAFRERPSGIPPVLAGMFHTIQ
jgi:hypothetical protein